MRKLNKELSSLENITERRGTNWIERYIGINCPNDSDMFIFRLYKELGFIVKDLESTAHLRQKDSEDKITTDIVLLLRRTGYDASHDADNRGHADLSVKSNKFIWLGEAKIHRSYEWLLDGLKQLHTRYATGREDGSGILIYIKGANAKDVMDKWRSRLEQNRGCNLKETSDGDKKLTFWSVHQHAGSGFDVRTKHIGVSLYYKPEK